MRDYSQVLGNRQRNRADRQQNQGQQPQQQFNSGDRTSNGGTQVNKRTKFALANSLGTSAEAASGIGISRRQAHRIIDTAYRGSAE